MLLPGCAKGGEHQDYPYWSKSECMRLGILTMGPAISTHLFELQTIIAVDEFTLENGATWMLAGESYFTLTHTHTHSHSHSHSHSLTQGSQISPKDFWSGRPMQFWSDAEQLCCPPGSVILGNGRTWHSAGGNYVHSASLLRLSYLIPHPHPPFPFL